MRKYYTLILTMFLSNVLLSQSTKNVIFISVDDMSIASDTYGNTEVPTPNITRLAQHGVLFTNAYCQFTLCSPSRTSVLSGKRPDATNIFDNLVDIRTTLGEDYKFLPEYFNSFGYRTENYGKVGPCEHEREISWDYNFDNNGYAYEAPPNAPYWCIDTVNANETETRPGLSTTAVINQLKAGPQEPYFIGLGLSTHAPFTPTLDAWNLIGDNTESIPLQVDIYGGFDNVFGNGSSNISFPNTPIDDTLDMPAPARTSTRIFSDEESRNIKHAFYAEVIQTDQQLGRLLDAMDSLNTWENAIVVFWSDHGLHMGEHQGLWLKLTIFEECLRVPFIICAPGYSSGVSNRPVELVDIFPTLTELCNIPQADSMEGSSLVPLLEKPDAIWKSAIFSQILRKKEYNITGRAVRTEGFHYNLWPGNGEELFDLTNDPFEYTNLATNPVWQDTLNKMRNLQVGGWIAAKPPEYQKSTWFRDADNDGFGNKTDSVIKYFMPTDFAANNSDCNDSNNHIFPGAKEKMCNGIDDNCNVQIDENKKVPIISKIGILDICHTDSVYLFTTQFGRFKYQWYKNNIVIPGATSFGYVAKEAGSYTVEVTIANCTSASLPTVVINSCSRFISMLQKETKSSFNNGKK